MKVNYLKYSDERNKCFSIKTEINLKNDKKIVRKTAIFPEGKQHITNIIHFQELLKKYYDDVKICKAWKQDESIEFDFIEGEMLLEKYKQAIKREDITQYEKLLLYHKRLICGNSDNECIFEASEQFYEWFGSGENYKNVAGLKCSNFDAIATNIIIQDSMPVFIDYEWVMNFVMPKDLVIYHCIKDAYLHSQKFEQFYPFKKVMQLLEIEIEEEKLEESYKHFFDYVISDKAGKSYAKDKYQCLKSMQSIDVINKEWETCANNWKEAVKANEEMEKELAYAKKEWEACANNWKEAVKAHDNSMEELENVKNELQNTSTELEQMKIENQLLNQELTAIKNTKVWKLRNKVKQIIP